MIADPSVLRQAIDRLGGYEPMALPARPLGTFAFVVTVIAVGWIERLQYRLKRLESSKWWASNGRDVLNIIAVALMMGGLKLIGFTGPLAFCIAATLVIILSALQMSLSTHKHQAALSAGVGLVLSAPVLIFPAQVDAAFTRGLGALFSM